MSLPSFREFMNESIGVVKYFPTNNRLARDTKSPSGEFLGNFEHRGSLTGYQYDIYALDNADNAFVKKEFKGSLKKDQFIVRAVTPNMEAGGMSVLVMIDLSTGNLYFNDPRDEDTIRFSRTPIKAKYINWIDDIRANLTNENFVAGQDYDLEYDKGLKQYVLHFEGEMLVLYAKNQRAAEKEAQEIMNSWE